MKVKTYIINLKESIERKTHVTREVSNYTFMNIEWIEAVNGKLLEEITIERLFDIEKFIHRYQRPPSRGEIGCTLSHRKCYEHLLATDEPHALILEDDVVFICPEDTRFIITQGVRLLKEGKADIIVFVSSSLLYNRPEKISPKYSAYPVYTAYGTYAYLINRKGAEHLLTLRADAVADDFPAIKKKGLIIKSIQPYIAVENGKMKSLIEEERIENTNLHTKNTVIPRIKLYSEILYLWIAIKCKYIINQNLYRQTIKKIY